MVRIYADRKCHRCSGLCCSVSCILQHGEACRARDDDVASISQKSVAERNHQVRRNFKIHAAAEGAEYTTHASDILLRFKASQDVERATSRPSAQDVKEARSLLEREPRSARNAAQALTLIGAHHVREQGQQHVRDQVLDDLRVSVRNCVAMRIRAEATPHSEDSFNAVLNTAFTFGDERPGL